MSDLVLAPRRAPLQQHQSKDYIVPIGGSPSESARNINKVYLLFTPEAGFDCQRRTLWVTTKLSDSFGLISAEALFSAEVRAVRF